MSNVNSLIEQAQAALKAFDLEKHNVEAHPSREAVERLRVSFLGRKGVVTELYGEMRTLSKDDRPAGGKALNDLKTRVESGIESLQQKVNEWQLQQQLLRKVDVSRPTEGDHSGSLHPVTLIRREVLDVFRRLGFAVYDGPEIEYEYYNFTALNTPDHHPARDMQDTFYLAEQAQLILRSHTSNIQIHGMMRDRPPLRVVAPGRVFRCDSDPTHTPQFHQIEAFVVDENISFAHLKGTIDHFLRALFGQEFKTRLRPSFFPFVEPGAEIDLYSPKAGWLEIGGCGMIHPNVFECVGYDSERLTGFAFGFGLDRMAMLKYGLRDLRQLFSGDRDFLGQFPARG